jgi:LacI family transcriptional regulator
MQALDELGLAVPADVSVVGHNDQPVAASTVPPLTTCRPPSYEMGGQAVELILEAAQQREAGEPPVIRLACQLIGRSSVSFRQGFDWENAASAQPGNGTATASAVPPRPARSRTGKAR